MKNLKYRLPIVLGALLLALAPVGAPACLADVVVMKDGRSFEGEIIGQDAREVRIDSRFDGGIRTVLKLNRADIESIERKALPKGFFDPPVPAAPRVLAPDAFGADDNPYLVIPIVGRFGESVFAEPLAKALAYARRHRVKHVVFVIDSDGGDLDQARRAYRTLKQYSRDLTFHATVRDCRGVALAVPVWCDTMSLAPGAVIGGVEESMSGEDPDQEQVLRARIADGIARDIVQRGGKASVVRAMFDPQETVAAWYDEHDVLQVGIAAPPDLAEDRLVFSAGIGNVLVLDEMQASALGFPRCDGTVASLGPLLEYENWKKESDFGETAMAQATTAQARKTVTAQAKFDRSVRTNIERREEVERYIETNIQQAANWNPGSGSNSYENYGRRWKWKQGGFYRSGGGTWDVGARDRWKNRTDAGLYYLERAASGIKAAAKLDREAVELGLEPTFNSGELAWMADDIQMKYDYLWSNRGRIR